MPSQRIKELKSRCCFLERAFGFNLISSKGFLRFCQKARQGELYWNCYEGFCNKFSKMKQKESFWDSETEASNIINCSVYYESFSEHLYREMDSTAQNKFWHETSPRDAETFAFPCTFFEAFNPCGRSFIESMWGSLMWFGNNKTNLVKVQLLRLIDAQASTWRGSR